MITQTKNNNAFLIHISAFAGYFFPFGGVLAPLIFWVVKRDESKYMDAHGKEAVNFNLSFLLYTFILGLGIITTNIFHFPNLFGIFGGASVILIVGVIRFVLIIQAAIKASNNEPYQYPFTIEFIK